MSRYISAVMDKSAEALSSLFDEKGQLVLPFRRSRDVIVGRENIYQHYASGFSVAPLRFTSIDEVCFHYTKSIHVAVVEYRLHGQTLPEQKKFVLSYINVIRGDKGEIIELIDYEDVLNREAIFSS
ncbi:nuclear transport factor 2 family protein [Serratia sp. NPDC078593]|uniref:nuclear transport factor 2 family protein n=1 Tax=unclassified Serratia (in: enterobacteria) TaxID=2647522 RepID=UPI0037D0C0E3